MLVVRLELLIPVTDVSWCPSGDGLVEQLVHRGGEAGSLQPVPGEHGHVRGGKGAHRALVVAVEVR